MGSSKPLKGFGVTIVGVILEKNRAWGHLKFGGTFSYTTISYNIGVNIIYTTSSINTNATITATNSSTIVGVNNIITVIHNICNIIRVTNYNATIITNHINATWG